MAQPPRLAAAPRFAPQDPFWRLKREVIARTGHFYYEDKDDLLWERLQRRLKVLRLPDAAAYLRRLEDPELGEAEWAALEAEITIGETFFFRYREQFSALAETILPEIIARKTSTRRLRIWSAGCATGAEAYTLAIVLHELLGERLGDWTVSILGTDINDAFLAAARQAKFSPWALRALSAEERQRWFTEGADRRWTLRPRYRGLARFERGNLLDLVEGRAPLQLNEFDVILCRNVLIYFHPETVTRIVAALGDRLSEGGWLLLGHSEPNPGFSEFLDPVQLPGTVAYRSRGWGGPRPDHAPPPALAPSEPWTPLEPPAAAPLTRPLTPPTAPATATPAQPASPAAGGSIAETLDQVRQRAGAGDYEGAALKCREGLARAPETAALHFYEGLIEQALGQLTAAERAFRRAIYLDPGFAMAHHCLGLLLIQTGRARAGKRSIATAAQTATALPGDAPLVEGGGLTAGELRSLARLHLQSREGET